MSFVCKHYPKFSKFPHRILDLLYKEARRLEKLLESEQIIGAPQIKAAVEKEIATMEAQEKAA
jgi:hypothetical protein